MNSQNLYTIIFDYDGGTYVSQILCGSVNNLLDKWLECFGFHYISKKSNIKKKFKKEIKKEILLYEIGRAHV